MSIDIDEEPDAQNPRVRALRALFHMRMENDELFRRESDGQGDDYDEGFTSAEFQKRRPNHPDFWAVAMERDMDEPDWSLGPILLETSLPASRPEARSRAIENSLRYGRAYLVKCYLAEEVKDDD